MHNLLRGVSLTPEVQENIGRWQEGLEDPPLRDAFDEALALAELMLYILRPTITQDNEELIALDSALEAFMQELLPSGEGAQKPKTEVYNVIGENRLWKDQ